VQPVALYTCSLQYEDSISCTLYRFLLPLRRQFDFAPFFAVECKFFALSKKSSSAFSVSIFHPSIHPSPLHSVLFIEQTLFHKNPPSLSSFRSRPRRIFSDSRSSSNPFSSSSFYQSASFCSLGEYVSRPLLRENLYFIDFVYVLSVSSNLVIIPRIRNQLFSQSYDSCLQSRSAPSPSPLLLSRLRLVFVSISSMSSLRYRRYILIRSLHVSQPSPPSYSSRYIQCLPYNNIADTL
jgi:hypothetical protein